MSKSYSEPLLTAFTLLPYPPFNYVVGYISYSSVLFISPYSATMPTSFSHPVFRTFYPSQPIPTIYHPPVFSIFYPSSFTYQLFPPSLCDLPLQGFRTFPTSFPLPAFHTFNPTQSFPTSFFLSAFTVFRFHPSFKPLPIRFFPSFYILTLPPSRSISPPSLSFENY